MKTLLAITVALALVARPSAAQSSKVPDADVKKLADAFSMMFSASDAKKRDSARKDFSREFERIDQSLKPSSILAFPEVWSEVFYSKRTPPKAPSGMGRVEEKEIKSFHS